MWGLVKRVFHKCKHTFTRRWSTSENEPSQLVKNTYTLVDHTPDTKSQRMKVLNVAEKNDAAKNIAALLGRGNCRRREGQSTYNKIYEFDYNLWNNNCQMLMTSVSGHLLTYEFGSSFRSWRSCHPSTLFDAPVYKKCPENYEKIKRTLESEVRTCDALIIWTDCDREGENIGFEIIQVCKSVKPNIRVYRAVFSEITSTSVNRALGALVEPNKLVSDAVDVRSELDLRIGAAFTRFQTLRLQQVFPSLAELLISYGSCQFPTLGFVVERFLAIERFISEPYWKIKVSDVREDVAVEFRWARNRLFEKLPVEVLYEMCKDEPEATVEKVKSKPKSKWRPLPLDTVELEKQGSRKLRLNAKETMKIAEKLYSQGFISYPRTETNIFPKELNLAPLVADQAQHPAWGDFATRVMNEGINPRQGKKSDQAHPPIHPIKFTNTLTGNEAKVYEFVVRHFLACVSKNAEGHETIVDIDIAGEKFTATGLQILAKNYLEVYIYEKWNAKEIHYYEMGQRFMPTEIAMAEEKTSPPNLLTEADLIALMDKHGIGTDATHAEHIETIKQRHYVGLQDEKYLIPGKLGIGLVMGYDKMGFQMSKPNLRAELERDLKLICEGRKNPQEVLQAQIDKYREVFRIATEKANLIDVSLADYLDEAPSRNAIVDSTQPPNPVVFKCPKCRNDMNLRRRQNNGNFFISCSAFPNCKNAIWFPESVEEVQVLEDICQHCPRQVKKIKVKFRRNIYPQFGLIYDTCLGCDEMFKQLVGIDDSTILTPSSGRSQSADSGYNTSNATQNSSRSTNSSSSRSNTSNPPRQTNTSTRVPYNNANSTSGASTSGTNSWSQGSSNRSQSGSQSSGSSSNQQWNRNIGIINADTILCNCHQEAIELTVRKEGPNKGRKFFKCAKPQGGCNFFLWKDENAAPSGSSRPPFNPPPPPPPAAPRNTNNQWNRPASNNARNTNTNQWNQSASNNARSTNTNQWNQPASNNARSTSNNQWNQSASNTGRSLNESVTENVMCECGEPARIITVQKESVNKGRQFYGCPKGLSSGTCNFFKWVDELQLGNSPNRPSTSRGRGRGQGTTTRKPRATGGKRKCGICGAEGHTRKTCQQNSMD